MWQKIILSCSKTTLKSDDNTSWKDSMSLSKHKKPKHYKNGTPQIQEETQKFINMTHTIPTFTGILKLCHMFQGER